MNYALTHLYKLFHLSYCSESLVISLGPEKSRVPKTRRKGHMSTIILAFRTSVLLASLSLSPHSAPFSPLTIPSPKLPIRDRPKSVELKAFKWPRSCKAPMCMCQGHLHSPMGSTMAAALSYMAPAASFRGLRRSHWFQALHHSDMQGVMLPLRQFFMIIRPPTQSSGALLGCFSIVLNIFFFF